MAKVLFINPVIRHHDAPRHLPFGMAILVQQAVDAGHNVQVYDENGWRPDDPEATLVSVLKADSWDVIATGGLTTAYGNLKRILMTVRRECPNALIVAGGGFFSSMPRDMMQLRPEIDIGVVGEAYATLPEILKRASEKRTAPWDTCKGIMYRDDSDNLQLALPRPLLAMAELDQLPYPAYDMFPLDRYWANNEILMSEQAMSSKRRLDINASYGCSLICRFCWHLGLVGDIQHYDGPDGADVFYSYDRQIRWHSPEYVVKMVRHCKDKYDIDFVAFLDENLMTMHRSSKGAWLPEICRLWIEYGLQPECVKRGIPHDPKTCHGIHWGGTSHAGQVDADVLKLMYEAGCSHLDYGLESFNDRVLKNIGKGTTAEKNKEAVRITMDAGIRPIPNQIIGFPDEFFDSIYDNMTAWQEMGIVAYPFIATAYPGSEWYHIYKAKVLAQYDGDLEAFLLDLEDATKMTANICENFSTVELLGIRELMVNFDFRKIKEFENEWWARHEKARFPRFVSSGWKARVEAMKSGKCAHPYGYEVREVTRKDLQQDSVL